MPIKIPKRKGEIGLVRQIDGKRYLRLGISQTKRRAKEKAKELRKKGYSVRTVKAPYPIGYAVFGKKVKR